MQLDINIEAQIKRLSVLTKRGFFGKLVGEYRSAFKGKGLEFTGFRNYDANDDAVRIDWKASLRSQDLLVRQFEEERNLSVMFIFDTSNSMLFGSTNKLKAEYAAEMVGALTYGILRSEDSVGLIMFNEKVTTYMPSQIGDKQFFNISKELTKMENYGGNKDISGAIKFAVNALPKTTIIFFVSDFIGLDEEHHDLFKIMGNRFELVAFMVRDPNDNEMPDVGQVTISDPFTGREMTVDTTNVRYMFNEEVKRQKEQLMDSLVKTHSDIVEFTTDKDFMPPLLDFFKKRQKTKTVLEAQ